MAYNTGYGDPYGYPPSNSGSYVPAGYGRGTYVGQGDYAVGGERDYYGVERGQIPPGYDPYAGQADYINRGERDYYGPGRGQIPPGYGPYAGQADYISRGERDYYGTGRGQRGAGIGDMERGGVVDGYGRGAPIHGGRGGGGDHDRGRGSHDRGRGGHDRGRGGHDRGRGGHDRGRGGRDRGRGRGDRGRGNARDSSDNPVKDKVQKPIYPDENNWEEGDRHPLMQPLFMDTVPENFEQEWVFVVCPPGKRCLLVAARNTTQTYDDAGKADMKFESCLPSGSPAKQSLVYKFTDLTILDVIYSAEKTCFYIIDMVHWRHYPYNDTEAEFRFFCLCDKYSELKNPTVKSEHNEYPLVLLQKYPCTRSNIESVLQTQESKVEGLLFFNKSSLYVRQNSPDNLWLKLDQMEQLLGIPVPQGLDFAVTNAEDEAKKAEQEVGKNVRAFREEVTSRAETVEVELSNT